MTLLLVIGNLITFLKILLWFADSYGQDAWERSLTDAEEELPMREGTRVNSADMHISDNSF